MLYQFLCSLCVFVMFGYIAYGANDLEQGDKVMARSGNLESRLIVTLFSTMHSDIRELRTEIKEQQAKHEEEIEELKTTYEAEMSELNEKIENVEELEQLQAKHEAEIIELHAKIEGADIAKFKEEIELLKQECKNKPKTVYAQVQLRGDHTLAADARVKFTATVANIGKAYKTAQGYFEAPYDGTYLFTVRLCMDVGNGMEFYIVQDDNILAEGLAGDEDWHACASATAATYMRKGSKVSVKSDRVGGRKITDVHATSVFTGVLVNDFKKP
ncbi:MAG: hypothetical protein AB2693_26505 [Candidatus Thiodiazotropha sp.]